MKTNIIRLRAKLFLSSIVGLAGLTSASAQAATETFGQVGQFVIQGSSGARAAWSHNTGEQKGDKNRAKFDINPSVGLFIGKNVLLSADLGVSTLTDLSFKAPVRLSVNPRLGYNIDLGRGVSLLPQVGGKYDYTFARNSMIKDSYNVSATLDAPFYFQVVKHGALHFGPSAAYRFTQDQGFDLGVAGGVTLWI